MSVPAEAISVGELPLPVLRDELKLIKGPTALDGSPTWSIFDPVRNKYFRIGWLAFQLLSRWSLGKASLLLERVKEDTTCQVTSKDVDDLVEFLYGNSLTRDPVSGSSTDYLAQYEATKLHWFSWLLKNYLFIRIPLVRPNRFIQATLPLVEPLFAKSFRLIVIICGLLGIYLAFRQWDVFTSTFLYFFSKEGLFFYFAALVFIKILHELGHAYISARYGCRISTMGVCFLVMFPVLYTDTTDSWRLTSRRQRLFIGAGGMIVELHIALISTFLWSFLPDGILRSVAFIFATTSWTLSLAINTNVFMRFDGYYILSDWWGIENLQDRSFAFARWRLREILFKLGLPAPEKLSVSLNWRLCIYGWCVWVYRLFLYIGIALLVYHFFFKLLGLLLFAVELLWFILLPVYKEIQVWWSMKDKIMASKRFPFLISGLVLFLLAIFVPFSNTVPIPAVFKTANEISVHSLSPGRIKSVHMHSGQSVNKNDMLLVLESPLLDEEIEKTKKEMEVIVLRTKRRVASPDDLAETHVLLQRLQELESKLNGLFEMQDELTIRAPMPGTLVDIASNLHKGRWINEELPLVRVIEKKSVELTGIITGNNLGRIEVGQNAVFLPAEAELDEIRAQIVEIEDANVRSIENLYLTSLYGGDIAVRQDKNGKLVPEKSSYRVKLFPVEQVYPIDKVVKGQLYISGKPQSFISYAYDVVASVLVRESGF